MDSSTKVKLYAGLGLLCTMILSLCGLPARGDDLKEIEARLEAAQARKEAAFHMQQRAELMHELATIRGRMAAQQEAELKSKLTEKQKAQKPAEPAKD